MNHINFVAVFVLIAAGIACITIRVPEAERTESEYQHQVYQQSTYQRDDFHDARYQEPDDEESSEPTCYWMENQSGRSLWIRNGGNYRGGGHNECYQLDSCYKTSGGNGGCYKWASSADEPFYGWGVIS